MNVDLKFIMDEIITFNHFQSIFFNLVHHAWMIFIHIHLFFTFICMSLFMFKFMFRLVLL
jgi:hypothetical protein